MTPAPGEALRCAVCDVSLAVAASPDEVVTIGGRSLRFRRKTDFVVCQRCLALYRATDLAEGQVIPLTDADLLSEDAVVEDDEG